MTGELTLTGRVLPIGGLKEKILGAVRSGITEIILPKENEADLEDLPDEVAADLTFHCVEDLHSVIEIAIVDEGQKGRPKGKRVSTGSSVKGGGTTSRKKKEKEILA